MITLGSGDAASRMPWRYFSRATLPYSHSIVSALDKLLFLLKKIFFVRKTIVVDTVKKLRF